MKIKRSHELRTNTELRWCSFVLPVISIREVSVITLYMLYQKQKYKIVMEYDFSLQLNQILSTYMYKFSYTNRSSLKYKSSKLMQMNGKRKFPPGIEAKNLIHISFVSFVFLRLSPDNLRSIKYGILNTMEITPIRRYE